MWLVNIMYSDTMNILGNNYSFVTRIHCLFLLSVCFHQPHVFLCPSFPPVIGCHGHSLDHHTCLLCSHYHCVFKLFCFILQLSVVLDTLLRLITCLLIKIFESLVCQSKDGISHSSFLCFYCMSLFLTQLLTQHGPPC